MKETAMLERYEIADAVDPEKLVARNVLRLAQERLGYTHPDMTTESGGGPLTSALRNAGVKPLRFESVKKYKARMLQKHQANVFCRAVFGWDEKLVIGLTVFGIIVSLLVSVFAGVGALVEKGDNPIARIFVFGGLLSFVILTLWICVYSVAYRLGRQKAEWRRSPLSEYSKPIPGFALITATEIDQRMSGARNVQFFVEELVVSHTEKIRDPFLIACTPERKEGYYLEVWEEPSFKAQRIA